MMVDDGSLHPDEHGSITLEDMHDGMIKTGADEYTASFFAVGVIVYDKDNKETQLHRDRCYPGTPCFMAKLAANGLPPWTNATIPEESERYLNIYEMNGVETVEHGFSTGVRGGFNNPPDFDNYEKQTCNGIFPCEEQFAEFIEPCADSQGRFFREQILCVVCRAQAMGDRGGEWSFVSGGASAQKKGGGPALTPHPPPPTPLLLLSLRSLRSRRTRLPRTARGR